MLVTRYYLLVVMAMYMWAPTHAHDSIHTKQGDICTSQGGTVQDAAVWSGDNGPLGQNGFQVGAITKLCNIPYPGSSSSTIPLATLESTIPTMAKLAWDGFIPLPANDTGANSYCSYLGGLTANMNVWGEFHWYGVVDGKWDGGQFDICIFADGSGVEPWLLYDHLDKDPIINAIKWGWTRPNHTHTRYGYDHNINHIKKLKQVPV